jgi:hypothetical protein
MDREVIYHPTAFDQEVVYAHALLECMIFLQDALHDKIYSEGKGFHVITVAELDRLGEVPIRLALNALHPHLVRPPYADVKLAYSLLSRIGEPSRLYSSDQEQPFDSWPRRPRSVTRRDFLYFYVMIRIRYLEITASWSGSNAPAANEANLGTLFSKVVGAESPDFESYRDALEHLLECWGREVLGE